MRQWRFATPETWSSRLYSDVDPRYKSGFRRRSFLEIQSFSERHQAGNLDYDGNRLGSRRQTARFRAPCSIALEPFTFFRKLPRNLTVREVLLQIADGRDQTVHDSTENTAFSLDLIEG
jgi:hypothetical protein